MVSPCKSMISSFYVTFFAVEMAAIEAEAHVAPFRKGGATAKEGGQQESCSNEPAAAHNLSVLSLLEPKTQVQTLKIDENK